MNCKNIMRRPVQTLGVEATVQAAAMRMKTANIGLIPICDSHGTAVGVLTDRDIAVRVVAAGLSPSTSCVDVMTKDIVSCRPKDQVEVIARIMARKRKSRILVCEDSRLIGIVSLSDLAVTDISLGALALLELPRREIVDQSGRMPPPEL